MKQKDYKSTKGTYYLPAVYLVDAKQNNKQYVSVNKPKSYVRINSNIHSKVNTYIPSQETHKEVELTEMDKYPIVKAIKPLDLKVGDIYRTKNMSFTVISVNENNLELKLEGKGKKTIITNEFSVTDFTALYYHLGEENWTITSTKKKLLIIGGGIVATVGLIVLIKKVIK